MESGPLRDRLTVQRLEERVADDGGVEYISRDLDTIWGDVNPLTGTELQQAQQTQSQTTHSVRFRHFPPLRALDRLIHLGRILEVLSIINVDERRREDIAMCVEVN